MEDTRREHRDLVTILQDCFHDIQERGLGRGLDSLHDILCVKADDELKEDKSSD